MTLTRVTSPFGFESTAAEVIAGIDLHGRRASTTAEAPPSTTAARPPGNFAAC